MNGAHKDWNVAKHATLTCSFRCAYGLECPEVENGMCGNMMQWYDMVFVLPAPHVYFVVQYINRVSLITLPGCSTVRKTDVAVVRMSASNPRKLHVDHISW